MAKKRTYDELEQRIKELESYLEQMEETLRVSVERNRLATSAAKVGVWDWNIKTGDFYLDPNIKAILGYSDDEIPNDVEIWVKYVHPEDSKAVMEAAQACLDGKTPEYIFEHRMLHKDGSIRWILVRGKAIRDQTGDAVRLIGTDADITNRKQVEEALRESEQKFRTLFEDSRDAIYITSREGLFIDINQAALDLFGYSREEMIGMNAKQTYVNDDDRRGFQQEMEEHGSVRHHEVKLRKKDGTEMYCMLTSSVRRANDGSIIGYQGIIHDVTEQKRLEAKLHQAHKLKTIGTLAGGIAHDFNNLLMGIQGNASLMLFNIDSSHEYYEKLKNIEKQVQSGARLTSQLLGYARKGKYEVKPIDLNQLVKETSDTFGRTRKQVVIHREIADDLFAIEADPGQIEQVLLNLFVNAADAMPDGGDLFLKTMNTTHKDMTGKLYEPKRGDYVMLAVTDRGMGINEETIEHIFDPFFTTKEMSRGTGLGLASAYGIIKAHGGYIDVESVNEQGTTFSIFLPASEKKVQKVAKTTEEVIGGTETVLLVDDEAHILKVGRDLLEAMGYQVLIARDGNEGVAVYKKNRDEIDIVVLDVVMPNMGGGEAYDRMKEINAHIKVLLSSGFSIDGEANEILARGCDAFIQKPFGMQELSQKIREVLDKN